MKYECLENSFLVLRVIKFNCGSSLPFPSQLQTAPGWPSSANRSRVNPSHLHPRSITLDLTQHHLMNAKHTCLLHTDQVLCTRKSPAAFRFPRFANISSHE